MQTDFDNAIFTNPVAMKSAGRGKLFALCQQHQRAQMVRRKTRKTSPGVALDPSVAAQIKAHALLSLRIDAGPKRKKINA